MWFENDTSVYSGVNLGYNDNGYHIGQGEFNPGEDISVCKVSVGIQRSGGDVTSRTVYCQIWTMDGHNLDTNIGESNGVVGDNDWDFSYVDFDFSASVNLNNGTDYAIVVTTKGIDTVNSLAVAYTTAKTGFDGGYTFWSSAGIRTLDYSSYDTKMKIYTD